VKITAEVASPRCDLIRKKLNQKDGCKHANSTKYKLNTTD